MTTATVTTAGGTSIAYEVTGDGPPVVLVHGMSESRRTWDPLVEPLATDHTVVALDLPGHGDSGDSATYDTDTLAGAVGDVIDAAGIDRPLLVGHSRGGWVVTAAAGVPLPWRGVLAVDERIDLAVAYRPEALSLEPALRGDEATFQRAMRESVAPLYGALSDAERARVEGLRRPRQEVVLAIWQPLFNWTAEEIDVYVRQQASGVDVPYLSLHGSNPGDGYAGWLTELIPHAVVEVWPDLGHYPHLAEPERFLARLRSFDNSTQASTP